MKNELQEARREIDVIDGQLAELFVRRMEAVSRIAAWKQANGLPVLDEAREQELLARNLDRIPDPTLRPWYAQVLRAILSASRGFQQTRREPPDER